MELEHELYDMGKLLLALEALAAQVRLEDGEAHVVEAHVEAAQGELRSALRALVASRQAHAA